MVEDRPYFSRQLFEGERFLQEVVFDIDNFVVEDGLTGVAGDEKQSGLGMQRRQFLGQLASTDVRHHDIGDGQIDYGAVTVGDGHGVQAVSGLEDGVAAKAEKLGGCAAQSFFILHQKHGFSAA